MTITCLFVILISNYILCYFPYESFENYFENDLNSNRINLLSKFSITENSTLILLPEKVYIYIDTHKKDFVLHIFFSFKG